MRFAIFISMMTGLALTMPVTVNAQSVDLTIAAQSSHMPVMQTGKRSDTLAVKDGFTLSKVSENLGDISALIEAETGEYYSADFKTGRIWQLKDQDKDGRIDSKRIMPHRFDGPSGLAAQGDALYVADKNAIWLMTGGQPPKKLAGLRNADSVGYPHPLSVSHNGKRIFLGLKKSNGPVQLLSVDTESGAASLVESKDTEETILTLVPVGRNNPPWLALTHSFGASLSSLKSVHDSHTLQGMALRPTELETASDTEGKAKSQFSNQAYLSRRSADGFDILSVPVNLGLPGTEAQTLLSGFLSPSGRNAWGSPAALLFDSAGLLISDRYNGDIYRVTPVENSDLSVESKSIAKNAGQTEQSEATSSDTEIGTPSSNTLLNSAPAMTVSTITGSQIGTSSKINSGSALTTGSTLLSDYKSLAEEFSEKEKDSNDETETQDNTKRPVRQNR